MSTEKTAVLPPFLWKKEQYEQVKVDTTKMGFTENEIAIASLMEEENCNIYSIPEIELLL